MANGGMIERVAERLHQSFYGESVRGIAPPWHLLDRFERERWLIVARAAIEAMREPTEAIISASFNDSSRSFQLREGRPPDPDEDSAEEWRMMIDAILAEEP